MQPVWAREVTKHRPVVGGKWNDVVKSSGERHGKAKYGPHPQITEAMIEKMEMDTIVEGTELPRPKEHVRAFWRKLDEIIGTSKGQLTSFIYVEYHMNGAVHGYPVTRDELVAKGADL